MPARGGKSTSGSRGSRSSSIVNVGVAKSPIISRKASRESSLDRANLKDRAGLCVDANKKENMSLLVIINDKNCQYDGQILTVPEDNILEGRDDVTRGSRLTVLVEFDNEYTQMEAKALTGKFFPSKQSLKNLKAWPANNKPIQKASHKIVRNEKDRKMDWESDDNEIDSDDDDKSKNFKVKSKLLRLFHEKLILLL